MLRTIFKLLACLCLLLPGVAMGQESSLLEQLDRETQAMYRQVQQSVVRVQLPPPAWVEDLLIGEHPAAKWQQLDPEVRQTLQQRSQSQQRLNTAILSTTQPTARVEGDSPAGWQETDSHDDQTIHIEPLRQGDRQMIVIAPHGGPPQTGVQVETRPSSGFTPANIAVIVDDQGHMVVPVYLEQRQFQAPVPVQLPGGRSTIARFVGSDRQTGLTVLKLDQPAGKAAAISATGRPAGGSLVMILSPSNDGARLSVWTDNRQEWGVVASADGRIAGFARHGQFLAASAARPVVDQLVARGTVTRPQVGLVVMEISQDNPLREHRSLGDQPAMHIQQVVPGSPADQADLQVEDILLRIGDTPIGDIPTLAAVLTGKSGDVPFTIQRNGAEQVVVVRLQSN